MRTVTVGCGCLRVARTEPSPKRARSTDQPSCSKPRTIVSVQAAWPIIKRGRRAVEVQASLLNLFDARYAYNFGNPFSGTHFGAPRTGSLSVRVGF